ncbi:MAG: BTAD domain-containing putative transcriptional regulator, partial [Actinomycetota bacterium]|nr:BTAD domain-containing putative transcriptional regulator [Actinomycetota bacterium]
STPDPSSKRRLLDEALRLWRGPALADVTYEDFARAEADRLNALRIDAIEARIDADLELGQHVEVIADLEALVTEHRFREGLYRRLMLAMYRSGRQADALRVFQEARTVLGDELGLEPSPELAALEEAILLQRADLTGSIDTVDEGHFPTPLTSFVGRSIEQARIADALERSRLVTLLGPGGVGKTRLAIEVVSRMNGPRGFVDLGPITAPELVVAEIIEAYRLDRSLGLGAGETTIDPEDAIVAHLRGRNMVLVVDNCEHVVDEVARLLERILVRIPDLRVVATSRERLGVPGEVVQPVPALSLPTDADEGPDSDAIRLFVERALAADPDFNAEAAIDGIIDICIRLDGIPLAIELAAARVRSLPVGDIASRLDDRFRLLTGGSRSGIARQRTLRAAIDWSYRLLDDREQRVFRRIALLSGPFGLSPAAAVASKDHSETDAVLDVLDRLVDKSMVLPVPGPEARFRLLENIRAFGRDELAHSGEGEDTTGRIVDYYSRFLAHADPMLRGRGQLEWLERLTSEYDNITAALDLAWAVNEDTAVAMTGRLGWFWYLRGMFEESGRWLDRAAAASPDGREAAMAEVHFARAMMGLANPAAGHSLQEALTLAERSGHRWIEASSMTVIGAFGFPRDREGGMSRIRRAREMFTEIDEPWGVALTFFVAAVANIDDIRAATASAEEAHRRFVATGDHWGIGYSNFVLGSCHRILGQYDSALDLYEASLEKAELAGVRHEIANIRTEMANVSTLRGDYAVAERHLAVALELAERYPWGGVDGSSQNACGMLARRTGNLEEAIARHTRAAEVYRGREMMLGVAYSVGSLGFALEMSGDLSAAEDCHHESLDLALEHGDQLVVAFALEGLAATTAAAGDAERAAVLLGAAHRMRSELGVPLPPGEDFDVARAASAARTSLDDASYEQAFAAGTAMPRDAVVELARRR